MLPGNDEDLVKLGDVNVFVNITGLGWVKVTQVGDRQPNRSINMVTLAVTVVTSSR